MRKLIAVSCVLISLVMAVSAAYAEEKSNYFLLRYGANLETKVHERYLIYENNSLKQWAIGTQAILADKDFQLVNPYLYYKLESGLQLGARYVHDSLGHDLLAPAFRYIKAFDIAYVRLEAAQYFDFYGKDHKTDIWMCVATMGLGWYYGAELWYFHTFDQPHNVEVRPVRIGYRFNKGLSPFVMYGYRLDTADEKSHNIYVGLEYQF